LNRPLDVVGRHVDAFGFVDDRSKPGIAVGITASNAGSHRDFFDDTRENLTALGIGGTLLMLDTVPL
jgi:hypothetical protein